MVQAQQWYEEWEGQTQHQSQLSYLGLKDRNIDFTLKWDFIERAPSFNPITKKCRLCLKEKYHILYNSESSSLNKRQEIFNTCRHRKQRLLENFKTWGQKIFGLNFHLSTEKYLFMPLYVIMLSLRIVTLYSYVKQACRIRFLKIKVILNCVIFS